MSLRFAIQLQESDRRRFVRQPAQQALIGIRQPRRQTQHDRRGCGHNDGVNLDRWPIIKLDLPAIASQWIESGQGRARNQLGSGIRARSQRLRW